MNLTPRKTGRCDECGSPAKLTHSDALGGDFCQHCYWVLTQRARVEKYDRPGARIWTRERLTELKTDWQHLDCRALEAKYGVPFGGIKHQARLLRLSRPRRFLADDRQYYYDYRAWPGLPGPPEAWDMTREEWNRDPDDWHRELCRKYA